MHVVGYACTTSGPQLKVYRHTGPAEPYNANHMHTQGHASVVVHWSLRGSFIWSEKNSPSTYFNDKHDKPHAQLFGKNWFRGVSVNCVNFLPSRDLIYSTRSAGVATVSFLCAQRVMNEV